MSSNYTQHVRVQDDWSSWAKSWLHELSLRWQLWWAEHPMAILRNGDVLRVEPVPGTSGDYSGGNRTIHAPEIARIAEADDLIN